MSFGFVSKKGYSPIARSKDFCLKRTIFLGSEKPLGLLNKFMNPVVGEAGGFW